jgi:hypothetical protein
MSEAKLAPWAGVMREPLEPVRPMGEPLPPSASETPAVVRSERFATVEAAVRLRSGLGLIAAASRGCLGQERKCRVPQG